uniref:Inhibitor of growth protein N-terminal histone-binding domain-containing protein n=1 Tax=Ditylenchus dipsaci TaxID=166011 RepID=A0A915EG07_9BILA
MLNNKLLDYKKRIEGVELDLNNEIQTLHSQMDQHKEDNMQLQTALEERDQALEEMECELTAKIAELDEADRKIQQLKISMSESAEVFQSTRAQVDEWTTRYQQISNAFKEQKIQLDEKMCMHSELEDKIATLKADNNDLAKQVEAAEAKSSLSAKKTSSLGQENAGFC